MEYTKGEWKVDYRGSVGHIKAVIGDISPTVCRYSPPPHCASYIPEEEQKANALLIASAPDLYEALKLALNFIGQDKQARIIVEHALTKAEGE